MRHNFERRVEDVRPIKSDINAAILEYLLVEGYPSSAANFSKEANLRLQQEEQSVRARQCVITYIHMGSIQAAIEALNDLEPQVLDSDPALHFALLRLQLVELIRTCNAVPGGDITPALTFATSELAPRAPTNPEFLEDLERTMALLVFPPDNLEPQLAALLHPDLRRSVADRVNKAILECQNESRVARVRDLSRLRSWAEMSARGERKDLPAKMEIVVSEEGGGGDVENGFEEMVS